MAFSASASTATAGAGDCRSASVSIAPAAAAAPAMSPRISSMPAAGLMEMPPVSKQTPLPTKATGAAFSLPGQRSTTSLGPCSAPPPTAHNAPMPSAAKRLPSSTSTFRPKSRNARSLSAKLAGFSRLPGSATRSRAKSTPRSMASARTQAGSTLAGEATASVTRAGGLSLSLLALRSVLKRQAFSSAPAAKPAAWRAVAPSASKTAWARPAASAMPAPPPASQSCTVLPAPMPAKMVRPSAPGRHKASPVLPVKRAALAAAASAGSSGASPSNTGRISALWAPRALWRRSASALRFRINFTMGAKATRLQPS